MSGNPGDSAFRVKRYPFYLLNRLVSRYNSIIDQRLRAIGLDIPSWRVLMILGESSPRGAREIAHLAVAGRIGFDQGFEPAQFSLRNMDDKIAPVRPFGQLDAVGHARKAYHDIQGADHYYIERPDLLPQAVKVCSDWLEAESLSG